MIRDTARGDVRHVRPVRFWGRRRGVQNGTVLVRLWRHYLDMRKKTVKKDSNKAILARVKKELAAPRRALSVREDEAHFAAAKRSARK